MMPVSGCGIDRAFSFHRIVESAAKSRKGLQRGDAETRFDTFGSAGSGMGPRVTSSRKDAESA
jgi:hypothetical protein